LEQTLPVHLRQAGRWTLAYTFRGLGKSAFSRHYGCERKLRWGAVSRSCGGCNLHQRNEHWATGSDRREIFLLRIIP